MSALALRPWAGPALFAAALGLDQLAKHLSLTRIDPARPIEVTSFFNLVMVWNPGVSFGMLRGAGEYSPWLLIGLALAISAMLLVWLRRERRPLPRTALWLVLAGSLGNVVDRARFGAVVDFLDFHYAGYHWPAFNLSDVWIVAGAGLLLLDGLFGGGVAIDEKRRGEGDARA